MYKQNDEQTLIHTKVTLGEDKKITANKNINRLWSIFGVTPHHYFLLCHCQQYTVLQGET